MTTSSSITSVATTDWTAITSFCFRFAEHAQYPSVKMENLIMPTTIQYSYEIPYPDDLFCRRCPSNQNIFKYFGYEVHPTDTDASHQNEPVVQMHAHPSVGNAVRAFLLGAREEGHEFLAVKFCLSIMGVFVLSIKGEPDHLSLSLSLVHLYKFPFYCVF